MKRYSISFCLGVLLMGTSKAEESGSVENTAETIEITPEQQNKGVEAFLDVYKVLQHPRCLNCHPNGAAPLQGEDSKPHDMNISRASTETGLSCPACHQINNSEAYGILDGPPGAPNWHLPDKDMPLIFEGRSPAELCSQLKNPKENGDKTLAELVEHVTHDPLVLWGWNPGSDRKNPPINHENFSKQFKVWAELGGPCPTE